MTSSMAISNDHLAVLPARDSRADDSKKDQGKIETKSDLEKPNSVNQDENKIQDFSWDHFMENTVGKKAILYTTASSAIINLISAPCRLLPDSNPLKNIINKLSMLFTRGHLLTYASAGIHAAWKQRNPFLLFSFAMEGVAAFLKLRGIYLFRGIATGLDGAITAIKDRFKKVSYSSFSEGWTHNWNASKTMFKEISENWSRLKEGSYVAFVGSLAAAVSAIAGMTIHDSIGVARDFLGALGDYGLCGFDHMLARRSGFSYLAGSVLDFVARLFNRGLASILGVKDINSFEKIRDGLHECAIALDRVGQYFFLKYNQELDLKSEQKTTSEAPEKDKPVEMNSKPAPDLHSKLPQITEKNYATAV